MTLQRNQNPVVGSTINLKLVIYNSNNLTNPSSVSKVDIYRLDPTEVSDTNLDGRVFVETITDITNEETGVYSIDLVTSAPQYTIGKYIDIWTLTYEDNNPESTQTNCFEIYPDLWYTSTLPAVYDFQFQFFPNRIKKGSITWLKVKIIPNVPRATDLERYYTNLAISSDLTMSMRQICNPCGDNCEEDILEDEPVTTRDKIFGFYKLDTTESGLDLDKGLFVVNFTLNYAGNVNISDDMHLEIY